MPQHLVPISRVGIIGIEQYAGAVDGEYDVVRAVSAESELTQIGTNPIHAVFGGAVKHQSPTLWPEDARRVLFQSEPWLIYHIWKQSFCGQ